MAGYAKRPAPKRRLPVVEPRSDAGFLVTRDTTTVKPPSAEELRRMKKREYQRRRNVI